MTKLQNYIKFKNGKKRPKEIGPYSVFGGNGILGYTNDYNAEKCIIIGRVGAYCGCVYRSNDKCWISDNAICGITYEFSDLNYFYYLLSFLSLNKRSIGSGQPLITQDILNNIEVNIPPLETQQKIAKVLSAIDDKIELNNSINNNLEQQAQAIFKSWFVDFEPFGGTMPENWSYIQLSDLATFVGGYSYKGTELQTSNCAMATIKNFDRNGGFKLDGFKEIIPSEKLKISQEVDLFDILVAHTDLTQNAEVIGNAELLLSKLNYKKIIFSMDLVKVVPNKGISKFLLATLLKSKLFKSHCLGYVNELQSFI